jgi:hypothetical protein
MRIFTSYLHTYGKVYGILLILSYAYILFCGLLVATASDVSAFLIIPVGFIALVALQFFLQTNSLYLMLGSCCMFLSFGFLIVCTIELNRSGVSSPAELLSFLAAFLFFSLLAVASGILLCSVLNRRIDETVVARPGSK